MTKDPVQELEDQIRLFRHELADVKKRQLTGEALAALQTSLNLTAKQVAGVRDAAAQGANAGTGKYHDYQRAALEKIEGRVNAALRGLSEARTASESGILARRRNVGLFCLFSALTGLATGALLSVIVYDHYLDRDFMDSIQIMGWDWACTRRDGFIAEQDNGRFCVFEITE